MALWGAWKNPDCLPHLGVTEEDARGGGNWDGAEALGAVPLTPGAPSLISKL